MFQHFPQSSLKPGMEAIKRVLFCKKTKTKTKTPVSPLPLHNQPQGKVPRTSWSVNLPFSSKKEIYADQSCRNDEHFLILKNY